MRHREEVNQMRYVCMGLSFWLTLIIMLPHTVNYTLK